MQWVRLDSLSPWARNARQHSDDSTGKLAAGIRRFGFLVPLTAWRDESRIAAGHGRRLAMLSILREDPAFIPRNAPPGVGPGLVPVMWENFATEAQFEAFAIADNRQAKSAEDDAGALAAILQEMDAQGLGFDGMGFDAQEIEQALQEMPELDIDDLDEDFVLAESDGMFRFSALVANEDAEDANAAISWWKHRQGLPKGHRTEIVVGELLLHWWQENKASRAPAFETAEEVGHGET